MQSLTQFQNFAVFWMFSIQFRWLYGYFRPKCSFLSIESIFVFVNVRLYECIYVFLYSKNGKYARHPWMVFAPYSIILHLPRCCFSIRHCTFQHWFSQFTMKWKFVTCILRPAREYWKFVVHTVIDIEWLSKDLTQYVSIIFFVCLSVHCSFVGR